jgi:hypothetical protein
MCGALATRAFVMAAVGASYLLDHKHEDCIGSYCAALTAWKARDSLVLDGVSEPWMSRKVTSICRRNRRLNPHGRALFNESPDRRRSPVKFSRN